MRKFYRETGIKTAGEIAAYSIEEAREISFGLLNAGRVFQIEEVERKDFVNLGFWLSSNLIYYPVSKSLTIAEGFRFITVDEEFVLTMDVRPKDTPLKVVWEGDSLVEYCPGMSTDGDYLYFGTAEDMMEFMLRS